MGERLYVTGLNINKSEWSIERSCKCFGKLYYYGDMNEMRSVDFLCGLIAGINIAEMNGGLKTIEQCDEDYEENVYKLYCWEYVLGTDLNGLTLSKTAMRRFTELFIEDKKKFDVYPCNDEMKKELFDFVDKHQLFELSHGG